MTVLSRKLFNDRCGAHLALGRKRATNGRGFVYLWIILYTFDLFMRLTTTLILQLTCYSLTSLFNLLSQIGGRVLWEHQVAGSNPVAPTLRIQVIERTPNLSFLLPSCLMLRKGSSRVAQLTYFLHTCAFHLSSK